MFSKEQETEYLTYLLSTLSVYFDRESATLEALRDCLYGHQRRTLTGNYGPPDSSFFLDPKNIRVFNGMGISVLTITEFYRDKKIDNILN